MVVECWYNISLPKDAFAESYVEDKVLVVPHGRKSWYESAVGWKEFGIITESDDEAIIIRGAVDLGLSVKWATCNVGAEKPEDQGQYYAWGETDEKTDYSWGTYKWCNGSDVTLTKYNSDSNYGIVDNKTMIDLEDDVAHVKWGGDWRMPTQEEFLELKSCTWIWTTVNGVNGYLVTSKKTGYTKRCIFIPASGYYSDSSLSDFGALGFYWTNYVHSRQPTCFRFGPSFRQLYGVYRCRGYSVRPVCP